MKVLILHDEIPDQARPDEVDALIQAAAIGSALRDLGHEPSTIGANFDLESTIARIKAIDPEVIFNIVESLGGHGRLIHILPGVLDALNIPYTGASAEAQFATSNKLIAKKLLSAAGISTPSSFTINDLTAGAVVPPDRYIIKSVWEHASIGLDDDSMIDVRQAPDSRLRLRLALESRLDSLANDAFADAFIDGRELSIALIAGLCGPQVLPAAEIVFDGYDACKPKIVGWRAKWDEESFEYRHTLRRFDFPSGDSDLIDRLKSIAIDCWRLFELRGYARVDFRVDQSGRPWVLEVNANPCLSPDAGFAAALNQAGLRLSDAVARILNDVRVHTAGAVT
jgi:D-alanine-D-alanine ligase